MGLGEILQNSVPEMIGAGIGAFLGYLFGVRQERRMIKEEDNKKREELRLSILTELKEHWDNVFSRDETLTYTAGEGLSYPVLFTSCFDSAISSGSFSLLEPEIQNMLSYHYNRCKMSNDKSISILDEPRIDIAVSKVERLREFHNTMREPLTKLIGLMERESITGSMMQESLEK